MVHPKKVPFWRSLQKRNSDLKKDEAADWITCEEFFMIFCFQTYWMFLKTMFYKLYLSDSVKWYSVS